MQTIKISPQNITKTIWLNSQGATTTYKGSKIRTAKVNCNPKIIINKPIKASKPFHLVFEVSGTYYFSCLFNQMFVDFNFDFSAFKNITLQTIDKTPILSFETEFGKYQTSELLTY